MSNRCLRPLGAVLVVLEISSRLASPATLEGYIRDSSGAAVPGATLEVQTAVSNLAETRSAQADEAGHYRLSSLPAGTFTLGAKKASIGEATFGPFLLSGTESKTINIVLKSAAGSIGFFDEPKFTVAGVSDNTYTGGHGSDAVVRSAESLTKATVSLGRPAPETSALSDHSEQGLLKAIDRDPNNPELYRSLAETEERTRKPLRAVQFYRRAAELDPSERNLFDWGTELLLHRAPEPAKGVYEKGTRLFPSSSRMLLGSAVALYMHGDYSEAAQRFFEATDLNPADPGPYLFLGKVQTPQITGSEGFKDRISRFAKLQPDNAWANYFYAAYLWKMRSDAGDLETRPQVRSFLEKALRLDPRLAAADLLLGDLYSEQHDIPAAIRSYQRAIEIEPANDRAHYQLAQLFRQTGELQRAQQEMVLFRELSKTSARQRDKERAELKQFVVTLTGPASN